MRSALAFLAFVAACATSAPVREPFSIDAFLADANGYVASRYEARERPAALIADLESQDFQCQHSATVSECSRARHAFASCWDVINVRVQASGVSAESNRRCMGATQ
ncbi:MAG: hypothetical protein K2X34_00425 [Hyphomonadaceae bacterium]|nr:hypothetical protein [Hyphomonadaceae bacterium]